MEENKIQNERIANENVSKTNYYKKTSQKIGDFFLGFLGTLILPLMYTLISFIPGLLYFFISVAILAALCILFFKVGRRFITIGIISAGLIPILIFGSCLLLLGGTEF